MLRYSLLAAAAACRDFWHIRRASSCDISHRLHEGGVHVGRKYQLRRLHSIMDLSKIYCHCHVVLTHDTCHKDKLCFWHLNLLLSIQYLVIVRFITCLKSSFAQEALAWWHSSSLCSSSNLIMPLTSCWQWQASYPCSGCGSGCCVLTQQNGTFTDNSRVYDLLKGAHCEWVIAPPGALHITLGFTGLNADVGNYSILVWQCLSIACTEQQQLVQLVGSYSETQNVTSTTGFMRVVFRRLGEIVHNSSCFNASWTSVSLNVYKPSGIFESSHLCCWF